MRRFVLVGFAAIAGSLFLPALASPAPSFHIVLAPARLVIDHDTTERLTFYNLGSEPIHLVESAPSDWVTLHGPTDLMMQPNSIHTTDVGIHKPAHTQAGDADIEVAFRAVSDSTATVKLNRGLVAVIIYATGVGVHHGLNFADLRVPWLADSWGGVPLSVRAVNRGNVHEIVNVRPFPPALLLRDSSKVLTTQWQPPLACLCQTRVGELSAWTLVLPFRAAGAALLVALGLFLLRRRFTISVRPKP